MDIFGENNLRSLILDSLSKGPKKGADLIKKLQALRMGTTKQGVYKALRLLIEENIVVKYRRNLMLNQIWINKLNNFVRQTDRNYLASEKQEKNADTLDWMKEGSKISFVLNDFYAHDKFYSHIFSLIIKKTDPQAPIYVYNPHEWFILGTNLKENETYLIDWLKERNRQMYFTIGHDSALDKKFRKEYSSEEFQIAIDEDTHYSESYYVNIVGNYIAETKVDKNFAEKINAIYDNAENENEAGEKIRTLMKKKYKVKITLAYDSQRSRKLKNKLGRNFFISKELRDK